MSEIAAWMTANWRELGELLLLLTIIAQAVYGHRWNSLMVLTLQLTYKAAALADLDEAQKRAWLADELYKAIDLPWLKALVSKEQCEKIADWLWAKLEESGKG